MARSAVLLALLFTAAAAANDPRATSPDGRLVASAKDKSITVATGQPARVVMKIAGHAEEVTALTWSPDGKMLVSGDKGGAVRVYDGATGKELIRLAGPKGVTGVSVSADGKTLSVVAGKVTRKFDMATGAEVK